MNQACISQPDVAPESEAVNLTAESIMVLSDNSLESAPTVTIAQDENPERVSENYYALHWGINE